MTTYYQTGIRTQHPLRAPVYVNRTRIYPRKSMILRKSYKTPKAQADGRDWFGIDHLLFILALRAEQLGLWRGYTFKYRLLLRLYYIVFMAEKVNFIPSFPYKTNFVLPICNIYLRLYTRQQITLYKFDQKTCGAR